MLDAVTDVTEPVLTITDAAREKILEVRAGETDPETLALWVEISGESGGTYTYVMEFRPLADAGDLDLVQDHDGLAVVLDADSIGRLTGAVLDFAATGMVMRNPNQPPVRAPWGEGATDLDNPIAQRITSVLAEEVNPAIAAHGGRADLVALEGGVAYVHMSGGCQGCGMAAATLSQGIETAILDSVPEVKSVVDVTDHASGANPYYAASH
jgi:Fe/S biogenesis protein NfuA